MREIEFPYTNQTFQPHLVALTPMVISVSELRVLVSEIFFNVSGNCADISGASDPLLDDIMDHLPSIVCVWHNCWQWLDLNPGLID
jgi:hypothetical protein